LCSLESFLIFLFGSFLLEGYISVTY
jgi:hypothetical protein